ncbi:hypothetical protein QAD02_015189 [Eretmocerus hayati]|uniref:Uncharacterized protein n=1 Tax=Eretmocerus hayati TaxID=131215 RepID=A0ACC2P7Z9_9HYME|nr:hypothetical protein QAD02_015189 [Eretmocerus hayati]
MNEKVIEADYFKESILFFKHHQWLYDAPVNTLLSREVLDKFPVEWLQALRNLDNDRLNEFVVKKSVQLDWPASLIDFVEKCQKLNRLPSVAFPLSIKLPKEFTRNLTKKKQHEIFYFSKLVHEQCLSKQINTIIDLGAGLGYICQLLNHLYHYKVLGLESRLENIKAAETRQVKYFPESISSVKYVCYTVASNSASEIDRILQNYFSQGENVCLIGLHACGDLSINMAKIYLEMEIAKCLILVSCCYHKMSTKESTACTENIGETTKLIEEKEYFNFFPVSAALKDALNISDLDEGTYFKRSFLRLACQETSDRWLDMDAETHDKHSFCVLARGVLELFCAMNQLTLKKVVRKGTRRSQCTTFINYLEDCKLRYTFESQTDEEKNRDILSTLWDDDLMNNLVTLWESNQDKQNTIELYTALQLLLQNVAESLVLLDRLKFLKEEGLDSEIFQIADRSISPRSNAIVSWKR